MLASTGYSEFNHLPPSVLQEKDNWNKANIMGKFFTSISSGAPNENIVQKHLNIALLNVF